jgi:putative heme-binding domain-containing protein
VGRSTLDALLHNIIDPNEVIGNGFEATEVELKDGSVLTGRVVEDTATRLKLLATGPVEHLIAKSDIAQENGLPKVRKLELSLMPEALEQMPDADFRNMIYYLLNPPQDNRPWTPALRQELFGEQAKPTASRPIDLESVALWNPDWMVHCPPFEGAPRKLSDYHGRRNVLMTHPMDRERPSALARELTVPSKGAQLSLTVAAHDRGDWELRVLVNDRLAAKHLVDHEGIRWKNFTVDLKPWSGQRIRVSLENAANDWAWEFGYWGEISLGQREPDPEPANASARSGAGSP